MEKGEGTIVPVMFSFISSLEFQNLFSRNKVLVVFTHDLYAAGTE